MTIGPKSTRRNSEDDDNQLPVPPDGGWGWAVVFASFAIHVISKFIILI